MTFLQKLFSFQGRMRRQDFWIATLSLWGASVALIVLLLILGWAPLMQIAAQAETIEHAPPEEVLRLIKPLIPLFGLYALFGLVSIWPALAICAKRLHDRDQSGLWLLLYVASAVLAVIPLAGAAVGLGVRIWWLVNLGILDGTPGDNRFGPSPKPEYSPAPARAFG